MMKYLITRKPWGSSSGLKDQSEGKLDMKNQSILTGVCKLSISPAPGLHTDQAGQRYLKAKDCRSIPKSEQIGLLLV